jgi:hypothetical protein
MSDKLLTFTQASTLHLTKMSNRLTQLPQKVRLCAFFLVSWCLGGETSRFISGSGVCLLLLCSLKMKVAEAPSYKGLMRIPIDLVTDDGVRLEKGQYELEVKLEKDYVLCFSSAGHVKAVVKRLLDSDPTLASASIPVVGTHYLRPSTEPLLTGEERRFSKTGKTQYEEETRDWKATLRVYKNSAGSVLFLFESKGSRRQWDHVNFKLSRAD